MVFLQPKTSSDRLWWAVQPPVLAKPIPRISLQAPRWHLCPYTLCMRRRSEGEVTQRFQASVTHLLMNEITEPLCGFIISLIDELCKAPHVISGVSMEGKNHYHHEMWQGEEANEASVEYKRLCGKHNGRLSGDASRGLIWAPSVPLPLPTMSNSTAESSKCRIPASLIILIISLNACLLPVSFFPLGSNSWLENSHQTFPAWHNPASSGEALHTPVLSPGPWHRHLCTGLFNVVSPQAMAPPVFHQFSHFHGMGEVAAEPNRLGHTSWACQV